MPPLTQEEKDKRKETIKSFFSPESIQGYSQAIIGLGTSIADTTRDQKIKKAQTKSTLEDIKRGGSVSASSSTETQAFKTLDTFADSRVTLITGMQKAGYATVEECRPIVIEWACKKTGAEYRETKAGKIVLVSDHPKYEGAKTTVRDIMLMIEGTTRRASSAKKEPLDPVAKIIEAFNKLTPAEQRKALKALVA